MFMITNNTNYKYSIIVVTQQLDKIISGIGLYSQNLIQSLIQDNFNVTVIAPEDQIPIGKLPYTFISVPKPIAINSHARWISLSFNFGKKLRQLFYEQQIDLIHFTDAREALFCNLNIPLIGNIHDTYAAIINPLSFYYYNYNDWFQRLMYYRLLHILEAIAFRKLYTIIANSNYTAQVITDVYKLSKQSVRVCYISIDIDQYQSILTLRNQINPHPPRVLFIGSNMQRKGLPILINSAFYILKVIPETEFWIVGKDKVEPAMRLLCDRLGVSDHFRFLGWVSHQDLYNIYAQCDIFVMPSLIEAFGVVFLEAMAAGLPVIGTRVGGIPEIIRDGINGILVEPGKPNELGSAIIKVLKDRTLSEKLKQAGLETVQNFNVNNMMKCTYRVYKKYLSNIKFYD